MTKSILRADIDRRTLLSKAAYTAFAASVASLVPTLSQAQTKLLWYVVFYVEPAEAAAKLFKEESGVDVDYIRMAATQATQTFEQEVRADQVRCSAVGTTLVSAIDAWKSKDFIQPYRSPEFDSLPADVIIDDYSAPVTAYVNCIAYNANIIRPEDAPKSYEDLLDPRWKDKLVISDPVNATGTFQWYAAMRKNFGVDYLTALGKQNILIHANGGAMLDSLVSGERPIAAVIQQYNVQRGIENGANLYSVIPPSGVPVIYEYLALPTKAPEAETAKKFIDFLLSQKTQTLFQDKFGMSSVRSDLPAVKSDRGIRSLQDIKRMSSSVADMREFAENQEDLLDEFGTLFRN